MSADRGERCTHERTAWERSGDADEAILTCLDCDLSGLPLAIELAFARPLPGADHE